ncbi:unnamed protein product [Coffea canephora]|uniref:Rx N-terminal domain-containing protein n=1 Tax=Coffea canephora TaxID=49390 RepID=A0A068VA04_COFCA|nr:unnamed protein product [Coffea canephora]
MADAAINTTINFVLGTAVSLAADRIRMILGVKKELERISATAETIQGFLADADGKMHSPGVQDWLKQLEGEVFKAEYVLDEVNYENLRQEVKYRGQVKKRKVCFFFSFSCFSTIVFRSRLASKIRDINTNLDRINGKANELGLVVNMVQSRGRGLKPTTSRQADSILVPNVVGRASDESKIVDMMLSPSDKVISVVPITGMGGLGKTTLAKSVYNNPRIDEHFGKKIWICLAKEIELMELFKFVLESLTRKKVEVDGSTSECKFFPALKSLTLEDMVNLVEWRDPDERLSISGCSQLTTAPTPSHFPTLEELEIRFYCHFSLAEKRLCHFPSLQHLQVSYCPNVTSLRRLNCGTCLESLKLFDCDNLRELPENLYNLLKSLKSLTISDCDGLTTIASEMLESCSPLQSLQVYECPNLVSFPLDLQQTPSLETCILTNCPELINDMPKGFAFLTCLTTMMIGPFSDYSLVDWSGLLSSSTLCELELNGMSDMESLPHQLQYLTTLTSLLLRKPYQS